MKIWLILGAAVASFFAGGLAAGLHYNAQISDLKATASEAAAKYQQSLLKRETEYAKRISAATDAKQAEIERLQSDLDSLRRDSERLRLAASRRSRVSTGAGGSCQPCQRQVAECVGLLAEGGRLVEEGSGLLRDLNADRIAVRQLKP